MTERILFSATKVGNVCLSNRIVMAPMTRSRAGAGEVATELNATYYAQRATAGLIITEASQISQQGQGYAWTPGIFNAAQIAGWKNVVDAVHAQSGHIALQLWHVGRISHPLLQPGGTDPVAPSAIQAKAQCFVIQPDGTPANVPTALPRALTADELPGIVADYVAAAQHAVKAGFDFVEIHAANGYLLNQFLSPNSNQRTDTYGGCLENRARLLLEVVDAVIKAIGAAKVGVRLSPQGVFNDIDDPQSTDMALYLAKAFSERNIAFLHIAEPDWAGGEPLTQAFRLKLREAFIGTLITCGGYNATSAEALLGANLVDMVAFGRPFIANPDLVRRLRENAPLNEPDASTFYGGAEAGYTDYPALG
ncbi:MAG: alkene reductase [Fluviibacter sp.]